MKLPFGLNLIYNLKHYDYELPQQLIAQHPTDKREQARLLHVLADNVEDTSITDLPKFLAAGDIMVINNTKVMPMRLWGAKESGGKIELLINRIFNPNEAEVMGRASRPPLINSRIIIDQEKGVFLTIASKKDEFWIIKSHCSNNLFDICNKYGKVPLPVYIKRDVLATDSKRYQTIYAKHLGAAAAPTAGLHLTKRLLAVLKKKGVKIRELTLHAGAGTFAPIRETDIRKHQMHYEWCDVPQDLCDELNQARKLGNRIVAVGTTCLRALETSLSSTDLVSKSELDSSSNLAMKNVKSRLTKDNSTFKPFSGWTNAYLYPGGRNITAADILLTNFHTPRSSLLLLVCAFSGYNRVMKAYKHAINNKYRFFSFGDAMLLHRNED